MTLHPMAMITIGVTMLASIAQAAPRGGVFIPRNAGYEGRVGRAHVLFDDAAGGAMSVVSGDWPDLKRLARVDMVFAVETDGDATPVEVRQSFDRRPRIHFLEEGGQRIGMRVLFKLYDADDVYHGHGMTETWLYPDGQMFVTAAATFENAQARQRVTDARLEIDWLAPMTPTTGDVGMAAPLDDHDAPARMLHFSPVDSEAVEGVALYWRTGRMEHNTFVYRGGQGAPYYHRWPDYFRQAYGIGAWASDARVREGGVSLRFAARGAGAGATPKFNTLFRLAVCSPDEAAAFVDAEREPAAITVRAGGTVHGNLGGYNDQEGSYELRKSGEPMVVELPADARQRTLRIKIVALKGHGAVTTHLDDAALTPQLTTDGGIADDPLAPIRAKPEAPADAAMVTVRLLDRPQVLTIREREGIQLVYQSRDPRRNLAIYSTRTGPRWSGLRFSLVDGHAREMRRYGRSDWALTDNLLHWFSYCGYTPEQMLDQLRDFEIIENGPERIVYRYTSANANDGAQSEYVVTSHADAPAMQISVRATFRVLKDWPYGSSQFFDVFPFRGVRPEDWWYRSVLWLNPAGEWKTMDTVKATYEGATDLKRFESDGFFALYSSDRGNMLMLTRNFEPALPTEYVICGNYIDFHMDLKFVGVDGKPAPPPEGFTASCEYELALWGDASVTRDRLIDIGRRSLEAGRLVLPAE